MRFRTTLSTLVLFTALVLLPAAGSAAAGPPSVLLDTTDSLILAGPVAGKIGYQGRLTDGAGKPLNGSHNLVFQLWDAATAGNQVGSDIVMSGVSVSDGLFTVELPVNSAQFTGQALWLRIQVNGQWLAPRQELLPVPYALTLRPGALISGNEGFSGTLNVDNEGGAPAVVASAGAVLFDIPTSKIGVFGAGRDGGVMGFSDGTDAFGGAFSGNGGVSGSGQSGPGGAFTSIDGAGVNAVSTNGTGLYAEAGTVPAVLFVGKDAIKANGEENGIFAWGGKTGGSFVGGVRGVDGRTDSSAEGGAGVYGESIGRHVDGVRGVGAHGVHGVGYTGVFGEGDVGVEGEGIVGVGGKSEIGVGVHGESTGGNGVEGQSSGGIGVEGKSGNSYGVKGRSDFDHGVYGETGGGFAAGVSGLGPTGVFGTGGLVGVSGYSEGEFGTGVLGLSKADRTTGVEGQAEGLDGIGVAGNSMLGPGVVGSGEIGVKGIGRSGAGVVGEGSIGVDGTGTSDGTGVTGSGSTGVYGAGTKKGVHGESSALGGEGVHGNGTGELAEGVLGTSALGAGVFGIAAGSTANSIGVWGKTSATFGLYTQESLFIGGTCVGCPFVLFAENTGTDSMDVGDVVSIQGITPSLEGHQNPVLAVRRATAAEGGILGVVRNRAIVASREVPSANGDTTEIIEVPSAASGRVAPGDYLFVVLQGLVQVRVDASAGAIDVGDELVPDAPTGLAHKVPGDMTTGPTLGHAMEPLTGGTGLIWVLVLGQ